MFALKGKYPSLLRLVLARAYREVTRHRVSSLVTWAPLDRPQEGCTAVLGMCSRLSGILQANLACLDRGRWPGLKSVVVVVDDVRGCLPAGMEERVQRAFPDLQIEFTYYTPRQAQVLESLKLPYAYAWLSWSIGIARATTRDVLIDDYDALILDSSLERRHERFLASGAKVQGVRWYEGGGVLASHRLATTFEAFVDAAWLRRHRPLDWFPQVTYRLGRSVDYDILLELQENELPGEARDVSPMELDDLVDPSQMIHQYTMFRKRPGAELPCFAMPMIPFFRFLGGDEAALERATAALDRQGSACVDLIGDGSAINLAQLGTAEVDWALKQMLQVLTALRIPSCPGLLAYGSRLYQVAQTEPGRVWVGDFLPSHRSWLETLSGSGGPGALACGGSIAAPHPR